MAKQRNYAAEYQRRIERSAQLGLSKSQARGHAKASELSVRELRQRGQLPTSRGVAARTSVDAPVRPGRQQVSQPIERLPIVGTKEDRYYRVVSRVLRGESLSQATRAERIAPRTVNELNREREILGKVYDQQGKFSSWSGGEARTFYVFTSDGDLKDQVPFDRVNASIMGTYWNAVDNALNGNDALLQGFSGVTVRDIYGNRYDLLTNVNIIRVVLQMMTDDERDNFDRLFYQRSPVRRAA